MKTLTVFAILFLSATAGGCAGFANVLAGAAGGGSAPGNGGAAYTPQCPQPITTPSTVGCVGGQCAVTSYPAARPAGC